MSKNLPINREEAIALLKNHNCDKFDFNHYLESEVVMRHLARHLNENEEYWAMLGLLHDIDWGITKGNSQEHLTKAPEILKNAGFDDEFISTIVSHGFGFNCADLLNKTRTKKLEHALAACETITGLIHAYALMKPIWEMDVHGLKNKFKNKKFAAAINRDIISEVEKLGISLDDFFKISIVAIKEIAQDVDLKSS